MKEPNIEELDEKGDIITHDQNSSASPNDHHLKQLNRIFGAHNIDTQQELLNELARTIEMAGMVTSSEEIESALNIIVQELVSTLNVEGCRLLKHDNEAQTLNNWISYWIEEPENIGLHNFETLVDDPIRQGALRNRQTIALSISGPDVDPTMVTQMSKIGASSVLLSPVVLNEKAVGLFELYQCSYEREFTAPEIRCCQALAQQAAAAIEQFSLRSQLEDEISKRKQKDAELRHLNRAHNMRYRCHGVLIQADNEEVLLNEVCQLIVDVGGYRFAWVGYAEHDQIRTVRPVAQAGYEVGYLDKLNITWADTERGRGPTGSAIRTGRPITAKNILKDPHFKPWREQAKKRGYASSIALPLIADGQIMGALNIYSARPYAFQEDEVALLMELAKDLSFGIMGIRTLEMRKRAEAADSYKTQFVSDVSHELRTPLSVITLLIGNLDTLYERLDDETRQNMIKDTREHVRILTDLLGSVLEISRIDSGRISSERQPINLSTLAKEETSKQEILAKNKGQEIEIFGFDEVFIWANEDQMRRVVRNLVNNAIKYTPTEGRIVCECRQLRGDTIPTKIWPGGMNLPKGSWAAFRIQDNGPGIQRVQLDRIFERFYRLDQHKCVPGTGLGLSIAQELIKSHDGYLTVESQSGKGSTFAFYLPLHTE